MIILYYNLYNNYYYYIKEFFSVGDTVMANYKMKGTYYLGYL